VYRYGLGTGVVALVGQLATPRCYVAAAMGTGGKVFVMGEPTLRECTTEGVSQLVWRDGCHLLGDLVLHNKGTLSRLTTMSSYLFTMSLVWSLFSCSVRWLREPVPWVGGVWYGGDLRLDKGGARHLVGVPAHARPPVWPQGRHLGEVS
jgi:hypothetical protein